MEWIKTTFGELKAGDVYVMSSTVASSVDRRGASDEIISDYLPDVPVYRLVSPERVALEKIRPLLQEILDTYNAPREVSRNFDWIEFAERATAALESK